VFEIQIVEAFEVTLGDIEDGLGEDELTFAPCLLAPCGLQPFGLLSVKELFASLGDAGVEAAAPVELEGPAFNGDEGSADLTGNGGVAAAGPELEVGAAGLKGAGGLAGRGDCGAGASVIVVIIGTTLCVFHWTHKSYFVV
jgi:hypothetical protein